MVVSNVWSKQNDFGIQKVHIFKHYVLSHDFWKNAQKKNKNLQPFYIVLNLVDKRGYTTRLLYELLNKISTSLVEAKKIEFNSSLRNKTTMVLSMWLFCPPSIKEEK